MFTTLSKAKAEVERMTEESSTQALQISSLTEQVASLTQERDEAREASEVSKQEIAEAKQNLELAEQNLSEARGEHESIEERIESEAQQRALDISASAGTRPVEDSTDSDLDPDEVTKDNFWQRHSSLESQEKQDFYNKHKHVIGRHR